MAELTTAVIDYFEETHDDYRWLWGIDRHLGLHCGYYDEEHRTHDAAVLNMNRKLAEMAEIQPGEQVVDLGCGVAGSAIWLAKHRGATVTAVNITPRHLQDAARHIAAAGVEQQVKLVEADFTNTPLPDASFDVVWALESFCYAAEKNAFLKEAHRLLKPGGRLIIADGFLNRLPLTEKDKRIVTRWREGWEIPSVLSVEEILNNLQTSKFQEARFSEITSHVVRSSEKIYRWSLLGWPFAKLMQWCGLRSQRQNRGILSGYYQYHARKLGLGIYGLVTAVKTSVPVAGQDQLDKPEALSLAHVSN